MADNQQPGRDATENNSLAPTNLPAAKEEMTIRDYFMPYFSGYGGVVRQPIAATNFELKPELILIIQQNQFEGSVVEDPYEHLAQFLEICDTIRINGVSDDVIRLRLFPFSIRNKAKRWYYSLMPNSVTTWDELMQKFLFKYFPPGKTLQLMREIMQFVQKDSESLYKAWDRFRDLLRRCPPHGLNLTYQICYFYNGLDGPTRNLVDAAAGGALLNRYPEDALNVLEKMAMSSYQWPVERESIENRDSNPVGELATNFGARIQSIETQFRQLATSVCALASSVEKLATIADSQQQDRRFPPETKDQSIEQCNVIQLSGDDESLRS